MTTFLTECPSSFASVGLSLSPSVCISLLFSLSLSLRCVSFILLITLTCSYTQTNLNSPLLGHSSNSLQLPKYEKVSFVRTPVSRNPDSCNFHLSSGPHDVSQCPCHSLSVSLLLYVYIALMDGLLILFLGTSCCSVHSAFVVTLPCHDPPWTFSSPGNFWKALAVISNC